MELNIKGASKGQILKKLFLSTLYLSAFTFGGGYVIVTLMKTKFVDQYHWIDEEEMLDTVNKLGIGPGGLGGTTTALAVNVNTYPTHIAGLPVAVNICCHVNRHIIREV